MAYSELHSIHLILFSRCLIVHVTSSWITSWDPWGTLSGEPFLGVLFKQKPIRGYKFETANVFDQHVQTKRMSSERFLDKNPGCGQELRQRFPERFPEGFPERIPKID